MDFEGLPVFSFFLFALSLVSCLLSSLLAQTAPWGGRRGSPLALTGCQTRLILDGNRFKKECKKERKQERKVNFRIWKDLALGSRDNLRHDLDEIFLSKC